MNRISKQFFSTLTNLSHYKITFECIELKKILQMRTTTSVLKIRSAWIERRIWYFLGRVNSEGWVLRTPPNKKLYCHDPLPRCSTKIIKTNIDSFGGFIPNRILLFFLHFGAIIKITFLWIQIGTSKFVKEK